MVDIPDHLLRRSAEAKAKALGVPVEQVLAEMRGETPPPADPRVEPIAEDAMAESQQAGSEAAEASRTDGLSEATQTDPQVAEAVSPAASSASDPDPEPDPGPAPVSAGAAGIVSSQLATAVSPRPVAQPEAVPEGVRPQRLLTVVKARAIQQVKSSPTDKVNTWPHLMIAEFTALLVMTGFLIILSVILQAPLLELANFNATPNPSKAPWYFLGLQELLSYYDPQIAGVIVPGISGLVGFMAIPYIDRNPSTKPSDRKFAIMLFTFFLAGSATLTMLGTLFRGPGFNFTYPWANGIWFDDLKDWIDFG